ncbi:MULTISPECIES: hypothetical protein [unclassified Duganella]|uniref:hypothetical protein n=1 Tax=unclassified Duganella TaxID=2636909 RepID=UPI00088728FD|nr:MULTISPECIES: hypothetical protein [unclassified Duganella]SDF81575.1 hypothetical protein SAMN05216320_1011408 [Duganella sp. OV458]SDI47946.1 hypothetical protein SAMN05428973_1017 [Duganella sp. OV510]
MTDYTKAAARADASLRRKGGLVTLRRVLEADYDPGTGGPVPGTGGEVDLEGTGVKLNYNQDDIDGTLIKQGDQQLLLSTLQRDGATMPLPTTADVVLIGAKVYTIANVINLEPTDVSLLYTLQLRGV